MNLPARIRSIEDLISIANSRITDSVMIMIDADVPVADIIMMLDEFIPLLLPVTHTQHWSFFDEARKEGVINLLDEGQFRWVPDDQDLATMNPQIILEYMASSMLEAA